MDLRVLMQSLDKQSQQNLASACETSRGHLKNLMYRCKPCHPELASAIERETTRLFGQHRMVSRWDLIPEKWHLIWPELVGLPGVPACPPVTGCLVGNTNEAATEAANDATQAQRA
jgi:hypothetical protein